MVNKLLVTLKYKTSSLHLLLVFYLTNEIPTEQKNHVSHKL